MILHEAVWGKPVANVIADLDDATKGAVEGIYSRWRQVLCNWVKAHEKAIKFGSTSELREVGLLDKVEADSAIFRRVDLDDVEVEWQEYHGMKRRGGRTSSVLVRTPNSVSSRGKRGWAVPPPTSTAQWEQVRAKRVGLGTLVHRDGAPAYNKNPPGIFNDTVSHSSKKKKYAKPASHTLEDGSTYDTVAGTESLDGWWSHGKRAVSSTNARYPASVDRRLREAQWRHWIGGRDRWQAAGEVIAWIPES